MAQTDYGDMKPLPKEPTTMAEAQGTPGYDRFTGEDGRSIVFPKDLRGPAWLVGPNGGEYRFDASALRSFLEYWAKHSKAT